MKQGNIAKQILMRFLDSLPNLPSQSTSKIYVEPIYAEFMMAIYNEYTRIYNEKNHEIKPVEIKTFLFNSRKKTNVIHVLLLKLKTSMRILTEIICKESSWQEKKI